MAKSRLITTNLLRILDRISQPVYLVNDEFQIEYANKACLDWVKLEVEQVKSARCVYSSEILEDPIENRLRGLTPTSASVENADSGPTHLRVYCESQPGKQDWRLAVAHRLIVDGKVEGQLVFCSGTTFPSSEETLKHVEAGWQTDPQALHEALAIVRSKLIQRFQLPSLLGLPSTSRAMRKRIEVAVKAQTECIIFGPSGSGREHLARSIDAACRPDSSPPIPLHCSVADQQLVQRNIKELMVDGPSGNQSQAECLLLLDVDQLSDSAQAELWGFMQLPGFSFQTIATASRSVAELAEAGKFHTDLAGYLSTIEIELMPLSKRPQDIPLIAQSCLEQLNKDRDKPLIGFSSAAIHLLQQYSWPDNIDQLSRNITGAAKNSTGNKIVLEDLPKELRQARLAQEIGKPDEIEINLDAYLLEIERELIQRAMQHAKGNKSKAAKLLHISRPKLLRRLHLLNDADENEKDTADQIDSSVFEEAGDE